MNDSPARYRQLDLGQEKQRGQIAWKCWPARETQGVDICASVSVSGDSSWFAMVDWGRAGPYYACAGVYWDEYPIVLLGWGGKGAERAAPGSELCFWCWNKRMALAIDGLML